jgi:PAB-dependent poly(A)-specific ribonuclease subunit 3
MADVPQEVDNYENLVQLEPSVNPNAPIKSILGYPSTCYKASHKKDGSLYCLRRIHSKYDAHCEVERKKQEHTAN